MYRPILDIREVTFLKVKNSNIYPIFRQKVPQNFWNMVIPPPKPRGKYSVSACCDIWQTLSVVVGPLFAEQNTPLQPVPNRHMPVQSPPWCLLVPTDSRARVEVTVDSIQTVQSSPLSAVLFCTARHSPNLSYSKGMGSHAAAIRFLKVV